MNKVVVNGVEYTFEPGEVLVIIGDKLRVGSQVIAGVGNAPRVELVGEPVSVYCAGRLEVTGDVQGDVNAQGNVNITGDVAGGVEAQGDVIVGRDVLGDVDVQGDVTIKGGHQGNIDAQGSVRITQP